jgi:two-component system, chemotaxis family, CheB/CheR fusion protein
LISNAIKFTNAGEVAVLVSLNRQQSMPSLEIAVRDTGIGITEEQRAKLFTPFNQATRESTKRFGGTGLGLSISKRLAEGMGGTIHVESEVGMGSCFTLVLPITDSQLKKTVSISKAEHLANQQGNGQANGGTLPRIKARILLADDRRDVWRIGKYFLEKCGADVTVVEDGRQAVDEVRPFERIRKAF